MTSKVFTVETLREIEARAANGFAVTLGDVEFTRLADAIRELDAIYDRHAAIAVECMRQYRRSQRREADKFLTAPRRIAESVLFEAANAILRAVGMQEWVLDEVAA